MEVFPADWLAEIRARFERPGVSPPPLYRFATLDKFIEARATVQKWIDALPQESATKVVQKLRHPHSFRHTYNELRIVRRFLQRGLLVEYEAQFGDLTPDWVCRAEDAAVLCVIEVLSRDVSARDRSLQKQFDEIWDRLTKIECGVWLNLEILTDEVSQALDSRSSAKVSKVVERWLEHLPNIGSSVSVDGLSFEVRYYSANWTSVQLSGPANTIWVDTKSLKRNIEEKVSKYRSVINVQHVPFLVGVVPEFATALSQDSFEDMLFGSEVVVLFGEHAGKSARRKDGLFHTNPDLSGVIGDFDGELRLYKNSNSHANFENPSWQNLDLFSSEEITQ